MTPTQIIILILQAIAAQAVEEYPADLLAKRRAAWIAQVESRDASSAHEASQGF